MNEIKCPKCNAVFQADESGLAEIVKQIQENEVKKALEEKELLWKATEEKSVELATIKVEKRLQSEIAQKEQEKNKALSQMEKDIEALRNEIKQKDAVLQTELARKEAVIAEQKALMQTAETKKQLEIKETVAEIEKERDLLRNALEEKESFWKANEEKSVELATIKAEKQFQSEIAQQRQEKTEMLSQMEKELEALRNTLKTKDTEYQLAERTLKDQYENTLKAKDEQIAFYKDMKAKLSTKMVGETLEQHCEIEFNRLRSTAFPNAYFEKDSDVKAGTKGDYIFKESDINGNEIISIMFEMKNENDETATKKRNEDFLDKLDKDRNDKKCEYAVLVSLLEADNELYNNGIVDVSHRHAKMYVIRPQFFIPIISLLRNAALNALKYKTELAIIRNQNIDISNFEADMNTFKEIFGKHFKNASDRFRDAIDGIDKTMNQLQKIKDALQLSEDHLRRANNKAEDLTIKRLTKDNPTMTAMFEALKTSERE